VTSCQRCPGKMKKKGFLCKPVRLFQVECFSTTEVTSYGARNRTASITYNRGYFPLVRRSGHPHAGRRHSRTGPIPLYLSNNDLSVAIPGRYSVFELLTCCALPALRQCVTISGILGIPLVNLTGCEIRFVFWLLRASGSLQQGTRRK